MGCGCGCYWTTTIRPASTTCSPCSIRNRTSKCACSIRLLTAISALWAISPISPASTGGCTIKRSPPTIRPPFWAVAISVMNISTSPPIPVLPTWIFWRSALWWARFQLILTAIGRAVPAIRLNGLFCRPMRPKVCKNCNKGKAITKPCSPAIGANCKIRIYSATSAPTAFRGYAPRRI